MDELLRDAHGPRTETYDAYVVDEGAAGFVLEISVEQSRVTAGYTPKSDEERARLGECMRAATRVRVAVAGRVFIVAVRFD